MTTQEAFEQALQHHQAGRLGEAETLCRQVLAVDPHHADARHFLGIIAHQVGRQDLAAELIRQAIDLKPDFALAHFNLGNVLKEQGHLDEAAVAYRRALRCKPRYLEAHTNLGIALAGQGRFDEAAAAYCEALQIQPGCPEAHYNLGCLLAQLGQLDEAVAAYRRALEFKPHYVEAHVNLGIALAGQRRFDEAVAAYRRGLELQPGHPEAHNNLGAALAGKSLFDEAIAAYSRALEIRPGYADAHANLGAALAEQGRSEEAMAAYRRALQLQPDNSLAKFNYSLQLLICGDYERGWPLFEARWAALHYVARRFSQPRWDGSRADGRRVLIHAEQGLGDSIHLLRYAPLIASRGGEVLVECPRSLVELFRSAPGVSEVVADDEALPPFDLHVPMLSLPLVFQTTLETIPREVPYLFADPARRETWRERLGGQRSRRRIGFAWAGNPQNFRLQKRDVPLEKLLPLLQMEGVDSFSLQMERGAEQIRQLSGASGIIDHTGHINDLADTAAFMAELDLIISVDTVVVHLAGALGRPVWTLLSFVADWRWGLESENNPWYPTMRLFRQLAAGDWDPVIRRVMEELSRLANDE